MGRQTGWGDRKLERYRQDGETGSLRETDRMIRQDKTTETDRMRRQDKTIETGRMRGDKRHERDRQDDETR
jgi:hypothetical protein